MCKPLMCQPGSAHHDSSELSDFQMYTDSPSWHYSLLNFRLNAELFASQLCFPRA